MTRAVQEAQAKFRDRVDEVQDACWAAMAAELDRLGIPRHEIGRWDEMQDAIRAYLDSVLADIWQNGVHEFDESELALDELKDLTISGIAWLER